MVRCVRQCGTVRYSPAPALCRLTSFSTNQKASMNNISSPQVNDSSIEQEIQDKGLTKPRVTPDVIDALMARVSHVYFVHETSTFCHAFLDGTFYLCSGHSACVSKENFDHALGRKIAYNNMLEPMRNKLWELEGYALRLRLAEGGAA